MVNLYCSEALFLETQRNPQMQLFGSFCFSVQYFFLTIQTYLKFNHSLDEEIVSNTQKRLTGIDGKKPEGRME